MALKFVICGLEHSGTTLLSDIFRQVDELDSGFEVGVLLGDNPTKFPNIQPFYRNMSGGWKIDDDLLKEACTTKDFKKFYQSLKSSSKIFTPEVKHIFDKTPRYFSELYSCYEKVQVPFIALYKDPRSVVYSDYKRRNKKQTFLDWYENYKKPKLRYLSNIYNKSYLTWKKQNNASNIICISLENICLNTRESLEKLFNNVNYEFHLEYLMLKKLRYAHTRQPEISSRIPFEYLEGLTKKQISIIEEDFQSLEDWFYL